MNIVYLSDYTFISGGHYATRRKINECMIHKYTIFNVLWLSILKSILSYFSLKSTILILQIKELH